MKKEQNNRSELPIYEVKTEDDLYYFRLLPPIVRHYVMFDAPISLNCKEIWEQMQKYPFLTNDQVLELLKGALRKDALKVWGAIPEETVVDLTTRHRAAIVR